ncbi:MAG TPA: hypothetical protein P5075_08260 [Eubacteriales bacterium]|nr:hypothetical protein [Eubacteriales bacterium]
MKPLVAGRIHYRDPADQIVLSALVSPAPAERDFCAAIRKAAGRYAVCCSRLVPGENGALCFGDAAECSVPIEIRDGACDLQALLFEQRRIPFCAEDGEFFRFFLFRQPEATQLVVVSSHLAGDGISVVFLLRDVLHALAAPDADMPAQPMRLMEDFGYPKSSRPGLLNKLVLRKLNRMWRAEKRVFSRDEYLDMYRSYWQDRHRTLLTAELSGEELQRLIARCRGARVTLNSALCASLLGAFGTSDVGMAVSVRPSGFDGMGNFASGLSVHARYDEKQTFRRNARRVHRRIYRKLRRSRTKYRVLQSLQRIDPTLIDAIYFSMYAGFESGAARWAQDLFKYSPAARHLVSVTNLGRPDIPARYGPYTLDSVLFIPPLIATSETMLGALTVGGTLTLTMQFDEGRCPADCRRAFEAALCILRGD